MAQTFDIFLVFIMNDYFKCSKVTVSKNVTENY